MNENNYRLKRHFSLVAHSPDVVELRHGVWNPVSFTVADDSKSGRLHRLVAALDGSLSAAEIAQREGVSRDEVEGLIDHLRELGAVESRPSSALDHYLDTAAPTLKSLVGSAAAAPRPLLLLGDEPLTASIAAQVRASLPDLPIEALGEGDPALRELRGGDASWLASGLDTLERLRPFEAWRDRFIVHASKTVHPTRLQILNRICLEHRIPWLHVTMDGPFLFVGPLFTPPSRACYACFETRVLMNLRGADEYQRYKKALVEGKVRLGDPPVEPALAGLLASHAAMEVLNYALTGNAFTTGKVLAIYLPTMEFSFNEALRLPGCPACSPVAERDDTELYFDLRAFIRS